MSIKPALKTITVPELNVGDIVHAHGARFEIHTATMYRETDPNNDGGPIMSAQAKWIDGKIENCYFGPTKDWTFQGNRRALACIEVVA